MALCKLSEIITRPEKICDRMAPVAYAEALTCRENGLPMSGCTSVGPPVMVVISVSSVVWHSGVHAKGVFFLVRAVSRHAMLV